MSEDPGAAAAESSTAWENVFCSQSFRKEDRGVPTHPPWPPAAVDEVIAFAKSAHSSVDQDQVAKRTSAIRLPLSSDIDPEDIENFVRLTEADGLLNMGVEERMAALDQRREDFKLDRFLNGSHVNCGISLEEACATLGIGSDLHFYPGESDIPPLKPHQVIEILQTLQNSESRQALTCLASECGLGKTIVMGGIIISKNRQMIKSQQQKLGAWRSKKAKSRSGSDDHPPPATDSQDNTMTTILLSHEIQRPKDPMITRGLSDAISAQEYARLGFEEFSPSLIIVPPNAIPEIYNELRKFFPDLIIYVYYYVTGPQWRGPKPRSVWSRQLKYYLAQWKRENYLPKTGRTVVLTSYHTWYSRNFHRIEERFQWKTPRTCPQETEDWENDTTFSNPRNGIPRAKRQSHQKKLDVFTSDQAPDCEITVINDGRKADGKRVWWIVQIEGLQDFRFDFTFLDDAQRARNTTLCWHQALRHIQSRHLCWVTGSPLYSHPRDLLSPLKLSWKIMNLEGWRTEISLDDIEPGLYDAGYDPYHGLVRNGVWTPGIFKGLNEANRSQHPKCFALKDAYDESRRRLWLLDPGSYLTLGERKCWDAHFGVTVTRSVLRSVSVRHSISSSIQLASGHITYAGLGIPSPRVFTEELSHCESAREELKALSDQISRRLAYHDKEDKFRDMLPTSENQDSVKRIRFDTLRTLILLSMDSRHYAILRADNGIEKPLIGHKHVWGLICTDPLGGLKYFFNAIEKNMTFPTSPFSYMKWLLADNPVQTRVLELVKRHVTEGEKVVIFCDYPWIQQLTVASLSLCGFRVRAARSFGIDKDPRHAVINDFRKNSHKIDVLVATTIMLGYDVSLHQSCHRGIILNYHMTPKALLHIEKRLTRIGQLYPVKWHLLKCKDTFNDSQERISCAKLAVLISVECSHPLWAPMITREMAIYEVLRFKLGQTFNRYAWVIVRELKSDLSLHDKATEALGHLVSVAVRLTAEISTEHEQGFWCTEAEYLMDALYLLAQSNRFSAECAYEWLRKETGELAEGFVPRLREAFDKIKELVQHDPEFARRIQQREEKATERLSPTDDWTDELSELAEEEGYE